MYTQDTTCFFKLAHSTLKKQEPCQFTNRLDKLEDSHKKITLYNTTGLIGTAISIW